MDAAPPSPEKKSIPWLRWLGTLLAVGLLIYLVVDQGWQALVDSLAQVGWGGFLVSFLLIFCSRLATIGRWHTLLRAAGIPIPLKQSARLTFAGLFTANFLPTTVGGDVVRFGGAVRLGYDGAVAAASLIMDRLVGMAGMATVLPFGLVRFLSEPLPVTLPSTGWMGGMAAAALPGKAAAWLRQKLGKLWGSLKKAMRLWLTQPRRLFIAYLYTWGHMLFTFLAAWYLFKGMGESIPLWLVGGLWSMSYFVTLLPVSINGMGVQELTISFFFVNYGQVSLPSALALAILMRALPLLTSLPGALFVPSLLQPEQKGEK